MTDDEASRQGSKLVSARTAPQERNYGDQSRLRGGNGVPLQSRLRICHNTWFVNSPERLKAFRAIRRGVMEVVGTIREGTFVNDFKGSPLETVLDSITEQKQVFEGALAGAVELPAAVVGLHRQWLPGCPPV